MSTLSINGQNINISGPGQSSAPASSPGGSYDSAGAAASAQTAAEAFATAAVAAEVTRAEAAEAAKLNATNNLSDVESIPQTRNNLELGTAALASSASFDAAGSASSAQTSSESFATAAIAVETSRAEAAEATKVATAAIGVANGIAALDGSGHLLAAQGANLFSRQIEIAADGVASSVVGTVGTWTPNYYMTSDTGGVWSGWINVSDGAQNDSISFDFACGAGTYTVELLHLAYINRGIYTVKVDGATVGTVDGYAAALTPNRGLITGVAITAGAHTVTLLMATQDASASGYEGLVERLILTRTS